MEIQLELLEIGTVFQYNGKKYKKSSQVWNSTPCIRQGKILLGSQEPDIVIRNAHPYLGEQYQTHIDIWFSKDTIVSVD